MEVLVYKTADERVRLEYETSRGYHSFTATHEVFVSYSEEEQRDYCESIAEDMGSQWFIDNPDKSFYDLVDLLMDDNSIAVNMEDLDILADGTIQGWDFISGGQSQDLVPSEIVELWDTYHLENIETVDTEEGIDSVKKIKDVINKYKISL